MYIKIILLICLMFEKAIDTTAGQMKEEKKKVIIIDPGHGGIDSGTISDDGMYEKDIVLDIARSMTVWNKGLLETKYEIYLTRNKDTLISLDDRTKLAKHLKPDVFISLHCNHIEDSDIKGIELYTYNTNELFLLYANAISAKLNQELGFMTRKVKQANFQVLRETTETCSSVLLELGYLSNSDESNYLKNFDNRKALALAILLSI